MSFFGETASDFSHAVKSVSSGELGKMGGVTSSKIEGA